MQVEAIGTRDRLSVNNNLVKFVSFLLGTNFVGRIERLVMNRCRWTSSWSKNIVSNVEFYRVEVIENQ